MKRLNNSLLALVATLAGLCPAAGSCDGRDAEEHYPTSRSYRGPAVGTAGQQFASRPNQVLLS